MAVSLDDHLRNHQEQLRRLDPKSPNYSTTKRLIEESMSNIEKLIADGPQLPVKPSIQDIWGGIFWYDPRSYRLIYPVPITRGSQVFHTTVWRNKEGNDNYKELPRGRFEVGDDYVRVWTGFRDIPPKLKFNILNEFSLDAAVTFFEFNDHYLD